MRLPKQNDERRRRERVEQVAGPAQRPAADDDGHHHRRADRGGLPAGGRGVKPDQRNHHQAAPRPRHLENSQQTHQDAGDERNVQSADGEDVHRAGAHERFVDFVGERRFPTERHGPHQTERFVIALRGQPARERALGPDEETISEWRRGQARRDHAPVVCRSGFELIINSLPREIGAVVEQPSGHRHRRCRQNAADFDLLAREKGSGQFAGGRDDDATLRRLPVRSPIQTGRADLRQRAEGFLFVTLEDAEAGRFAQRAAHGHRGGGVARDLPQIIG